MSEDYIEDWDHFLAISKRFEQTEKIYRGQADSSWHLTPSLTQAFKAYKIPRARAVNIEDALLKDFQESNCDPTIAKFKSDNRILWWSVMQHFGVPTRLLDWSTDINVALYFAICDALDQDGSLYFFDDGHLNFIRHVRKTADWANIDLQLARSIAGEDYETSVYAFTNEAPIDRKDNQKGCFTITTELTEDLDVAHNKIADKLVFDGVGGAEGHSLVSKYIVDKSLKTDFLAQLTKSGITADFLFPGLDGLGKRSNDLLNTMINS
jgi:hypothetical protein